MDMNKALIIITSVEMFSIVCLFLLIILYIRHKEHHILSGKIILNLLICDIIFYTLDIFAVYKAANAIPYGLCYAISVLLYFSQFASMIWTNVMAYDIFHTISSIRSSNPSNHSSRYLKYWIFTCLINIIFWLPVVTIDYFHLLPEYYTPQFAKSMCYMNNLLGYQIFFEAPYAFTLFANCFILGVTMREVCKVQAMGRQAEIKQDINRFYLCIKLVFLMGVSEVAIFIHYCFEDLDFLLFLTVFSSLHGFFIFLIFGWKFLPCKNFKHVYFSSFEAKKMQLKELVVKPETENTKC